MQLVGTGTYEQVWDGSTMIWDGTFADVWDGTYADVTEAGTTDNGYSNH